MELKLCNSNQYCSNITHNACLVITLAGMMTAAPLDCCTRASDHPEEANPPGPCALSITHSEGRGVTPLPPLSSASTNTTDVDDVRNYKSGGRSHMDGVNRKTEGFRKYTCLKFFCQTAILSYSYQIKHTQNSAPV